jgi:glycosyltransferase involved in cell wall biosynthesis
VPAERIVVIHPAVDSKRYIAGRRDAARRNAYIPVLGRLKRYKGVEFALRALAQARGHRGDITLDICGQGDDRSRLERLAAELGLGPAVRFLGFVSEEEKRRLLRQAWAVVFPSPKEGWGITNVEAAACGTPAIASNSDGLRESVRDGVTGYLVPHGDVSALADRMLAARERSRPRRAAGARGARIRGEPLLGRAARATLAHLESTIGK